MVGSKGKTIAPFCPLALPMSKIRSVGHAESFMVHLVRQTPLGNVSVRGSKVIVDKEVLFSTGRFEVELKVLPIVGLENREVPIDRLEFELIMSDFMIGVIIIRL